MSAPAQDLRWPRGLKREDAATYVGVSARLFDEMVSDGRMPKPKCVNARRIWDRHALDAAFSDLPDKDAVTSWDRKTGFAA